MRPDNILKILNNERVGTVFHSRGAPLSSKERKKWILNGVGVVQKYLPEIKLQAVHILFIAVSV